jgi:hypothetical protein
MASRAIPSFFVAPPSCGFSLPKHIVATSLLMLISDWQQQ